MASIISHSPAETSAFARQLAPRLRRGDVLALAGDLGAGKTQFVKGLAEALGVEAQVTSPTFTLIHEYPAAPGGLPLFHIDLYRLESCEEVLRIGIDDYLDGDGVTVVEWADKFENLMPSAARWVRFRALEGDDREITVS